jgi:hypothetical protein
VREGSGRVAQSEAERLCLSRLAEMDAALTRMQGQLPDDSRLLGESALAQVRLWQGRLGQGGVDLTALSEAMRELSSWLEALAARLVLTPWERAPDRTRPS